MDMAQPDLGCNPGGWLSDGLTQGRPASQDGAAVQLFEQDHVADHKMVNFFGASSTSDAFSPT